MKFLGKRQQPTEGVILSGTRIRARTKNGCDSGESQQMSTEGARLTGRISQVKGQRIYQYK